ncbi:hypothetical protein [Clostridium thermobutyricum]|uniref:MOSC domain protein n=1 Tax=Clostridium thermobutyricum DSM 4928 TaxID=1121339 RepID=A0A1V4STC8_9CLOT|nr:hypothetical protein [Clostridium thermobutyricum]OPX47150.1 hypothetical protein CLTHE_21580 [Clostridium thermobutyricum DSM 4928]
MNINKFISNIFIKDEFGRHELNACNFIEGYGILGDLKGGTPLKEIVLYISPNIPNSNNNGLCSKKFKPNIIINNISISEFKVNQTINIGTAILKINQIGKKCYKECSLIESNTLCPLKTNVIFASVIKSGKFEKYKKEN